MFLNGLNLNEKSAFYALATGVMEADSIAADIENLLMDQYLQEMSVSAEDLIPYTFEDSIGTFLESDMSVRNQIYIELFSLAMCDNDFDPAEQSFINNIADRLGIVEQKQSDMQQTVLDLLQVYKRIRQLIIE